MTVNPLTTATISKQLKFIGGSAYILISAYILECSFASVLHSDINQTAGSSSHLSMWENRYMHATVCLLCAGQPRRAGYAAKSVQFKGQFSCDKYVPQGGPISTFYPTLLLERIILYVLFTRQACHFLTGRLRSRKLWPINPPSPETFL